MVAYGDRLVLLGASVAVEKGEAVAVLGANGSGKSTLIRAALGLVPLARGEAALFGVPLKKFRDWKRDGYVQQRLGAGSGVPATVREVVASGRLARRGWAPFTRAADRAAVSTALDAVGLADRANDRADALSGGQQQRVAIARALVSHPDLLVLDEPTAGVDASSQQAFAGALGDFVHNGGTVLLVAHELGPLAPLVNRAVVVHLGRIVHDGPVPEPAGHHADPDHDHVHPHAPEETPSLFGGSA
ncbi:metal ABC transporter ATP-binding protein [Virgisporangium ochraceum]